MPYSYIIPSIYAYLKAFTTAKDYAQTTINSCLRLASHRLYSLLSASYVRNASFMVTHLILLLQQGPPLAVTKQCPLNLTVSELCYTNLAGICAIGLVKDILCADFDFFAEMLACQEKVEEGRGDDDLCQVVSLASNARYLHVSDTVIVEACGSKRKSRTGVGVDLCVVEVVDDVCDLLHRSIPDIAKTVLDFYHAVFEV